MNFLESKYKNNDHVYCWEWNFLFGRYPTSYKIMSSRKLWLFWFYYLTRVVERKFYCWYLSPERVTHKIRERSIEYIIPSTKSNKNENKSE